jgi:hypothetical protein
MGGMDDVQIRQEQQWCTVRLQKLQSIGPTAVTDPLRTGTLSIKDVPVGTQLAERRVNFEIESFQGR